MANPKTTHFPTATYSTANRQVNHALFPAPATSVSSSSSGPANRRTAAPHQDEGQKCIIQRGARPSAAAIPNNHPASSSSPSPSSSSSPYISSRRLPTTTGPPFNLHDKHSAQQQQRKDSSDHFPPKPLRH
ncbi:hypothetical protein BV898_04910 [Hypsibius exemplaris]|uniref:Uncharacterized protein n=1 Tax=Hypsibius exemplaris TaxID=2072580 RepID=A0A1W0X122_HYPEX|nr:hypothetical protein BV898_04910 [Hypsibius exemplaris]